MRSYGTLYGMLNGLNALGAACGPIFASYIYDTSGTYNAFLLAGVAGSLLCAVLLFTLPPYPTWENATELPGRAASPSG